MGRAEELGELSVRQRVPTTYFQPVGLRLHDLDWGCNPPALHTASLSLCVLSGQQRLRCESRARQSDGAAGHVTG